jgi:hypothetical protein
VDALQRLHVGKPGIGRTVQQRQGGEAQVEIESRVQNHVIMF